MAFFLSSLRSMEDVINERIDKARALLAHIASYEQNSVLSRINVRIGEFELAQSNAQTDSEKKEILEQYDRFSKTLLQCLKYPDGASGAIYCYHLKKYHPVGIIDREKPNPLTHNLALGAATLGVALLLGSIPAFIFNPVIGTILLSAAITLLIPSIFTLLIPDSPDTTHKKAEEKALFEDAALLLKPDLIFEEPHTEPYSSSNGLAYR